MKRPLQVREDGYSISRASFADFPALKRLAAGLSEESRARYNPWMFRSRPPLKIRLGQWLARLSLLPLVGPLIKQLFPFGYAVILKCEKSGELVGNICLYHFVRKGNGRYTVTESKVIRDRDQGRGLSGLMTEAFIRQALAERVETVVSGTLPDNIRNKKTYQRYGWRYRELRPDAHEYRGDRFAMEIWELDLSDRY